MKRLSIQFSRIKKTQNSSSIINDGNIILDLEKHNFKVGYNNEPYSNLQYWIHKRVLIPDIYDAGRLPTPNLKPIITSTTNSVSLNSPYYHYFINSDRYYYNISSDAVLQFTGENLIKDDMKEITSVVWAINSARGPSGTEITKTGTTKIYMMLKQRGGDNLYHGSAITATINANTGKMSFTGTSDISDNGNYHGPPATFYITITCTTNYGSISKQITCSITPGPYKGKGNTL